MTKLKTYLKSFRLIYLVLVLLSTILMPAASFALTDNQKKVLQSGIYYFNTEEDSSCLDLASGSGPLYGVFFPQVDPTDLTQRIKNYISNTLPSSPLIALAQDFVKFGSKYNVNPVMVMAMTQRETSLGTAGYGRAPQYNVTNIRGKGPGGFNSYGSLSEGVEAAFIHLRTSGLYLGPPKNFTTVSQVINVWAPAGDKNDPNSYTTFVNEIMKKVFTGVATDNSAVETTSAVSSCGQTTTPGSDGWSLTGSHAMVNYDQIDPKWASHPYGTGKPSIGSSGCGPTSLAMIGATLLGDKSIDPVVLADRYGSRYHSFGTDWALMPVFAKDYNLGYKDLGTDLNAASQIIRSGGLVLISVDPGYFTNQGHFMVVRAVTSDGTGFYLADPNGTGIHKDSETRAFSSEFLLGEGSLKHLWGYSKQ